MKIKLILLYFIIMTNFLFGQILTSEDVSKIEIYHYNKDGQQPELINENLELVNETKLLFNILSKGDIGSIIERFNKLDEVNNWEGNYDCFSPTVGFIVYGESDQILATFCMSIECEKVFFHDYMNEKWKMLYFHNNNVMDSLISIYSLQAYRRY